ncbi:MAG: type IV toxin-antitoxin system AbiEi family antitoxin domain-containing protein [Gammaproteobacteria bacterium]
MNIFDTHNTHQQLLRALMNQGHYIFNSTTAKQIATQHGIAQSNITRSLATLVKQGWLIRLKRDLFAGTGQLPGRFTIPPFAIATHLVNPSAISHWSALHYYGFTEQIPHKITAITPKKITFPTQYQSNKQKPSNKHIWEVSGLYYEYIRVKPSQFFGIQTIWLDEYFSVSITDKERTLLELLTAIRYFGGIGEILGILETALSDINIATLIQYALDYNNAAVIKRLGWILDYFSSHTSEIELLYHYPIKGYRVLDPTKPKIGHYNKRWMIIDNITGHAR